MRLKSFYAKTMTEAMKMVRDTLGEEAVIVSTREERGGGVRLTAAMEQQDYRDDDFFAYDDGQDERGDTESGGFFEGFPAGFSADFDQDNGYETPRRKEARFGMGGVDDDSTVSEALTDVMLRHAVPDEIIDHIVSCATVAGMEESNTALVAALEHLFAFRPLAQKSRKKAWMMVGPPGAGKTLATAKLAARGVMDGKRVAVISTDTVRAGGVEQLEAFTRLMRIKLQKASDQQDLRECIEQARMADRIVIDTGGVNPFNTEDMRALARLAAVDIEIEPVLVMQAGIDADESADIARVYAALGVRSMLSTRLDIARRLGGLLAAAHHGGLVFADASQTPKVADGLNPLTPKRLGHLLMPRRRRGGGAETMDDTVPESSGRKRVRAGSSW